MKALIIGIIGNESHEASVRDAFVIGYNESVTAYGNGSNISASEVEVHSTPSLGFQAGFDWCKANNVSILINSYVGMVNRIDVAKANYPDVTLFMPAGANSPGEIVSLSIPQVICITGAGDVANETADNVEFISHDPIGTDEQDYSSFSNGYIAGQIAFIADTLNCSIWEARYRAAITGSENGIWDEVNGYGFINVTDAINFNGLIIGDPFDIEGNNIPYETKDIVNSKIGVDSVKLVFSDLVSGKEKKISRKNFTEEEFTELSTITGEIFEDEAITRRPKPYTYKIVIDNYEYFLTVLFCKVDALWIK